MDAARSARLLPALAALVIGLAGGVGVYTFVDARGWSYLMHDPSACANCHIMTEQFDGWLKSPHRAAADCNGCHVPEGLAGKWTMKAVNGFKHSLAFTTQRFHEPIEITPFDRRILEQRCRECHSDVVSAIDAAARPGAELSCVGCHRSVGHMHSG